MAPSLPALLLAVAALAAPPAPTPLDWDASSVNDSLEPVKSQVAGGKRPADITIGITVAVSPKSTVKANDLSFSLYSANHIYNGLDPYAAEKKDKKGSRQPPKAGSTACGILFEYKSGVMLQDPDLPTDLKSFLHEKNAQDGDRAYYGGFNRLSELEQALLLSVDPPAAGTIRVFYIPGLGGGRGTSYPDYSLKPILQKMQDAGLIAAGEADKLYEKVKNTVILSDTNGPDTLAHEIGHILTNRGHVDPKGGEKVKIKVDGKTKEVSEYEGNLMITGGEGDGKLTARQCESMRVRAKKL